MADGIMNLPMRPGAMSTAAGSVNGPPAGALPPGQARGEAADTQRGAQPGADTGAQRGAQPGADAGAQRGAQPGADAGAQRGAQPTATGTGAQRGPAPTTQPQQSAPANARQAPPPPSDGFATRQPQQTTAPRPVEQLVPNNVRTAQTLPEVRQRFDTDFTAIKNELIADPRFSDDQRAQRAADFTRPYAQRFNELLTEGEPRKAPPQGAGDDDGLQRGEGKAGEGKAGEGKPNDAKAAEGRAVDGRAAGGRPAEAKGAEAREARGKEGRLAKLLAEVAKPEPRAGGSKGGLGFSAQELAGSQVPRRPIAPEERAAELQKFAQVLSGHGFEKLTDARTGKSGVAMLLDLMGAKSLAEFERGAAQKWELTAPPGWEGGRKAMDAPERDQQAVAKRDLGESPADGKRRPEHAPGAELRAAPEKNGLLEKLPGMEAFRVRAAIAEGEKPLIAPTDPHKKDADRSVSSQLGGRRTGKRLGPNMIWNVLHQLRGGTDESLEEKKEFEDRLTSGALLVLGFITFMIVIVVSLG